MKKIAILATNGFEEVELTSPKAALDKEGFETHIESLESGSIKSWKDGNWGASFSVDKTIDQVSAYDYNVLLLPGGVINPDQLRREDKVLSFVRDFFQQEKPVAAICHGTQVLIDAEVVKGRKMTSFPSIKKDLINAGANWVDEKVVVDQGFVTSRSPEDLDAFNSKLVEEVYEGKHDEQHA